MNAASDKIWFFLAVLVYGASVVYSVFLWRKGFRRDDWVNYGLYALAFCFHTTAMVQRGFSFNRCPVNNLYEAIAFVAWTIVAVYLVIGVSARLRSVGAFASPVIFSIGVLALMPGLDEAGPGLQFDLKKWASLHAGLILLAYGAYGLGAVAGLMYLSQDNNLKHHNVRAVMALVPSIQRLEVLVVRLLLAGFVLMTGGLAVAPLLMRQAESGYYLDPKLIWSVLVWVIYLLLLIVHWRSNPGGKRFSWCAIGSFAFVMLTFWGVNLLSGLHNP